MMRHLRARKPRRPKRLYHRLSETLSKRKQRDQLDQLSRVSSSLMQELILLSLVLSNMPMTLAPNIRQMLMKKKKSMAKNKRNLNLSTLLVANLLLLNKPSSKNIQSLMTMVSKLPVLAKVDRLGDNKLSNIVNPNPMTDSRLSETLLVKVKEKEVPLMP